MAITGDGSQATPYLVASVSDISDAITAVRAKSEAGTYYIKLTASIDGGWAEFPVLDFDDSTTKFFEFDGGSKDSTPKEIKNFVFPNGVLFGVEGDVIKNTTMYNFYTDDDTNGYIKNIEAVDSSISSKIASHNAITADNVKFTRTAFWCGVDDYDVNLPVLKFRAATATPGSEDNSNECDYKILVENMNATEAVIIDAYGSVPSIAEDSRFQGGITTITPDSITKYPALCGNIYPDNAVINYDFPAYSGTVTGSTTALVPAGSTGVINTTKILDTTHTSYSGVGLIPVTDTEMHSATDLTNKGFTVYDITPNS